MLSFKVCAERSGNAEMGLITLFLAVMIGNCLAYEIFEEEKRQQLFPFPRVGRSSYWNFIDDKRGGLVPFPRTGRSDGKRQGLIPFPRIGRSVEDVMDYYEDDNNLFDDWMDNPYDVAVIPAYKRAKISPRIGRRKKRSINDVDDDDKQEQSRIQQPSSAATKNALENNLLWQMYPMNPLVGEDKLDYYDNGRFDRQVMPFPRVGRGMFNPRIGKKVSIYHDDDIGKRAALIPRVGRMDPMIQTRAAFQPRVGRALVPRVGRSDRSSGLVHDSN